MIAIQNVYYMLSYAFSVLREQGYQRIATEPFDHTADLFAAILIRGITAQVKRGLSKTYLPQTEALSSLRGKMEIAASIKSQTFLRRQMICSYDVFSVNDVRNRILKSTMLLLFHSKDVSASRKHQLRRLLAYFHEVETTDLQQVDWKLQNDRNHAAYQMLLAVCRMVVDGLLLTQSHGDVKMMTFLDEQSMSRLYEKFLLAYYQTEFPKLHARASQISWQLDDEERTYLPIMQTDVTLSYGEKILIIDAKYYARSMRVHFGHLQQHTGNLYQMFTYVKNKEAELRGRSHEVAGLLLYAKTDEAVSPDVTYRMSGNAIGVKTLDLNQPFVEIRRQLDDIVARYFGITTR